MAETGSALTLMLSKNERSGTASLNSSSTVVNAGTYSIIPGGVFRSKCCESAPARKSLVAELVGKRNQHCLRTIGLDVHAVITGSCAETVGQYTFISDT